MGDAAEPAPGTVVGRAWPSEERPGAYDFDPLPAVFDWSDKGWIEQDLVMVCLAVAICNKTRPVLVEDVQRMGATDEGMDLLVRMLADFETVSGHLTALAAILDSARARISLTVDWVDE